MRASIKYVHSEGGGGSQQKHIAYIKINVFLIQKAYRGSKTVILSVCTLWMAIWVTLSARVFFDRQHEKKYFRIHHGIY
jgi:hypothetical protein